MTLAAALAEAPRPAPVDELDLVVEDSILRFLNGETDGEDLFNALYGDVLDEPIPAEMLDLVRGGATD
jgi:hypothetical protein